MFKGTVLNTRPISSLQATNDAFKTLGFDVIDFPCIEIVQSKNPEQCKALISQIKTDSIIVFTSQHSVTYAFQIFPDWQIPKQSIVIAVGLKTAQCLEQHVINNIFVPEKHNSQGVIDLLDGLKNKKSLALISAENGRHKIQKYVIENNMELSQINVYERQLPNPHQTKWLCDKSNINILATSKTILNNLKLLLTKDQWMSIHKQVFVCASSRIENHANKLGLENTLNTQSANPKKMAQKLSHFLSSN